MASSPMSIGNDESEVRKKRLLGFGFWVQGFRCFPWMAVNYFLKDGLGIAPSTLQILQNTANLPMVGKPLYGVISDAVYIRGQHRLPYIILGGFLQAISWLSIAFLSQSGSSSIVIISLLLLLSNLGASIVEVANDAIVAESGKQVSQDKKSRSGELQSFVCVAAAFGGILGNLLGGMALNQLSPKTMFLIFGLLVIFQLIATLTIHENSLNLPHNMSTGIHSQLSSLIAALRRPDIAYTIIWLFMSLAVVPLLTGSMFFYQTEYLNLDSSVIGISKVVGQVALLVWSVIYDSKLKAVSIRKLVKHLQFMMAVCILSDVLFVKRFYWRLGLPDSIYVSVFSGILEVLFQFKLLPLCVLLAQLCPPGCEGSLMAFVMSAIALAMIVSGFLGVVLASWIGIGADKFGGLPLGILVQAACTLAPVYWSSWVAVEKED
ncbi:putative folate-biopterin transporter 7 [Nymphaea thermarum]|nr:putative folate-biopterin transporter 7 [Nymphaea thermarum]